MIDLKSEEKEIREMQMQLDHLEQNIDTMKWNVEQSETTLHRSQAAQEVIQRVAQTVQQQAHEKISSVVTSCLEAVFEDQAYEFQIVFERKRGHTEAELQFVRGDLTVDPLTASGGGVVDVAAFALRAACLLLHRPRLSKLLVLDEPFRFVSAGYRDNVRSMLEKLAKDLDLQIILVTHIDELEIGRVIEL